MYSADYLISCVFAVARELWAWHGCSFFNFGSNLKKTNNCVSFSILIHSILFLTNEVLLSTSFKRNVSEIRNFLKAVTQQPPNGKNGHIFYITFSPPLLWGHDFLPTALRYSPRFSKALCPSHSCLYFNFYLLAEFSASNLQEKEPSTTFSVLAKATKIHQPLRMNKQIVSFFFLEFSSALSCHLNA